MVFSKQRPVTAQRLAVEEAKAIVAGLERAPRNAAPSQAKQIAPDFLFGQKVRRAMEVSGKPSDGVEIVELGSARQAGKDHVLDHPAAKRWHRVFEQVRHRVLLWRAAGQFRPTHRNTPTARPMPQFGHPLGVAVRSTDLGEAVRPTLVFLTNHQLLPAATICALYKNRWKVELLFKWAKQHLRIKQFFGTSENAVKTQPRIAISVYVLIAIIHKQLKITKPLYTSLQVLSIALFEKIPLDQALGVEAKHIVDLQHSNQLNLFSF